MSQVRIFYDEEYNEWIKIALALAEDSNVMGCGGHYLYVGRKGTE